MKPSYTKSSTDEAASTSDIITYAVTVTNTGLLDIFDLSVMAFADGAGISDSLACYDVGGVEKLSGSGSSVDPSASKLIGNLASYPDSGLRGGTSFVCTFSAAVGQSEVRGFTAHSPGCRDSV